MQRPPSRVVEPSNDGRDVLAKDQVQLRSADWIDALIARVEVHVAQQLARRCLRTHARQVPAQAELGARDARPSVRIRCATVALRRLRSRWSSQCSRRCGDELGNLFGHRFHMDASARRGHASGTLRRARCVCGITRRHGIAPRGDGKEPCSGRPEYEHGPFRHASPHARGVRQGLRHTGPMTPEHSVQPTTMVSVQTGTAFGAPHALG